MLNPITHKMKMMASRSKRFAVTPVKPMSTAISNSNFNKQNDSLSSNCSLKRSHTFCKFNTSKLKSTLVQSTEDKLSQILKDNHELKERIKTYELMQEFYLKQLQLQKKEKKNLQWRLSILSEEIQHTTQRKKQKSRDLPLLTKKIEQARSAMNEQSLR